MTERINIQALVLIVVAAFSTACMEPGEPLYGESLTEAQFEVYDSAVGVYPSEKVLEDPNNPFADPRILSGRATRFDLESNDDNRVTAFYSWATWLVAEPTGENQFYASNNLKIIWESGNAPQEDLPIVRDMAIAGFQALLDYFPDAVTFDETGTIPFELLTPAYQGIVDLGGTPEGGWIIIEDQQGIPRAVRP
jgi:hypothetical protein